MNTKTPMTRKLALRSNGAHKSHTPRTSRARSVTNSHAFRIRKWKQRFLYALRRSPSVKDACKAAGISRKVAYEHRASDEEFAEKWRENLEGAIDDLEVVAFKRAAKGDSQVLTFLLRCHRPEVYRERSEVGVVGGIIFLPEKKAGDE